MQQQAIMLSVKQVAELLGLTPMTVYRMIDRKELVTHRIGGSIRISQSDLDTYLKSTRRDNVQDC
jgi:excisionase family DNA binding protein